MLRFFPAIYPDELLYSAFSRYYKYTGKGSIKLTFYELFGNGAHVFSTIDFPYNISSFIRQFNITYCYTSEDIIFSFTMIPLYFPFLNEKMQQYALNSMKNSAGKNLYKKLGVMASSIKCLTNLKYCPDCLYEDLQTYGEVYFHRSHNLDGVFVCYKHNKLLRTNCPVCNAHICTKDKYQLTSLDCKCINGHDLIESNYYEYSTMADTELNHHMLVSKIVNLILNFNQRSSGINHYTLHDKYKLKLYQLGYLSAPTNNA